MGLGASDTLGGDLALDLVFCEQHCREARQCVDDLRRPGTPVQWPPLPTEADPELAALVNETVLQEARDRVRAAIVNSGESWPTRRITIALLPATMPKRGSMFDVALAVGLLAAAGAVPAEPLADVVLLGELGLDGRLRPTRGVLPAVIAAARTGIRRVVVPVANLAEAVLVPGLDVRGVADLADLLAFLRGEPDRTVTRPPPRG